MKFNKIKTTKSFSCLLTIGLTFSITVLNAQRQQTAQERVHDGIASHPRVRAESQFCTNAIDEQFSTRGSTFEKFHVNPVLDSEGNPVLDNEGNPRLDGGDACMTVYRNPRTTGDLRRDYLIGSWTNIDNTLIRESQRPSDTNRFMSYFIDIESNNNVYHGGYGWWSKDGLGVDDIVEFYVVEGWNDRQNPIFGMRQARYTNGENVVYNSNGSRYELWRRDNITAGTVYDDGAVRTFTQFKAVRVDSEGHVGNGRYRGAIAWETHFRQMERAGITPEEIFEISYTVEGFGTTSEAEFTLNATFRTTNRRFNFKSLDGENLTTVANKPKVSVSPNPTSGQFIVSNSESNITVQVYDLNGALVLEKQSENSSVIMNNEANLAPGLYIVKTISLEGTISTQKLVIN